MTRNRILVLGNDKTENNKLLAILLKNGFYGFYLNINDFSNESIKKCNPDLILIDIILNESNNNILKLLSKSEIYQRFIPMVYIASSSTEIEYIYHSNINIEGFLFRPVKQKAQLSTIKTTINKICQFENKIDEKIDSLRGNISLAIPHEFNTSINTIVGCCNIINKLVEHEKKELNFPGEYTELTNTILDSCRYISRLTENFILYSQLQLIQEQPEKILSLKTTSCNSPKENFIEVIDILSRENSRKDDLIIDIIDAHIQISPHFFHKIIYELLDNALKFSNLGCKIIINTYIHENQYIIRIKDYGRGMTPEQIKSIGAYQQFDRITHEQQGAGLGLIVTKLLVLLHGGTFNLSSFNSLGTTILISLPLDEENMKSEYEALLKYSEIEYE